MKTMRIIALIICVCMLLPSLYGCGDVKYKQYDSTGERYDCYLPKYIKVPEYTEIKVPNITYSVTEEILANKLKRDCAAFSPDTADPDRGAVYGDICDIVTECYMDGEILSSYTFELDNRLQGHSIVLGCYELDAPELDEQIVGMKVGETKTFTFNFPDPYYRSLEMSGKEAEMTLTLNHFYAIDYEAIDDDFFIDHYGYSLDQYKAVVSNDLREQYNGYIDTYKADLAWEYIFENTEVIEYPEEYDNLYEEIVNEYRQAAKDNDTTLKDYVKNTLKYESLDDFYAYIETYTKDLCKREMILYYIARRENLDYTEEYYEEELLEYADPFEIKTVEEAEAFVDYQFGLTNFKERIRLNYVYEWIGENTDVQEDITTYVNDIKN